MVLSSVIDKACSGCGGTVAIALDAAAPIASRQCPACGQRAYSSRYERIDIGLSEVCNLCCNMCRRPQEKSFMPVERVGRVMSDAARIGVRTLSFSGGEPFVHPHFRQILADALPLGMSVELVTNGTLVLPGDIATLEQLRCVTVSIDGTAAVHDHIRGVVGAWAKSESTLRMLAGSTAIWGTNTVIQALNADILLDTWRAIRRAGRPSYIGFTHVEVVPETRHLQPRPEQVGGIKAQLATIREECGREDVHFNDDRILSRLYDVFADKTRRYRPVGGCMIPQTFLGISNYGIFPCWHQGRHIEAEGLIEALESPLCAEILAEARDRNCVGCNAANYSWSTPWVEGIAAAAQARDWVEGVVYLSAREREQGVLTNGRRKLPLLERQARGNA